MARLHLSIFILIISVFPLTAQNLKSIFLDWRISDIEANTSLGPSKIQAVRHKIFQLDVSSLQSELEGITYREGRISGFIAEIQFPFPDGTLHTFTAKRNQTMHPLYNAKFPQIISLDAYAKDGSGAYGKWDITPTGLHAMIFVPGQSTVFIDPMFEGNNQYYMVYTKKDFLTDKKLFCDVQGEIESKPINTEKSMFGTCDLRTYRLALSATAEYTIFHGGTVVLAAAAQVTTMNRVNGVYEKDIAITMVIVPNNNNLIYTVAATDPFTNGTPGSMITQNQTTIDNIIGSANYDIGHVFGTNSGGLAGLGVVCAGGQKARGVTGSGAPIGDPFDIDYVAHEMGHQFGGNHTQNNNCNSVSAARREPGSASTIMGYAGICAPNVQNNSDDYFHGYNLGEISAEILSNGHQCEVITPLNNTPPTITSTGGNIIVPISTPFILTGHAIDPEGDVLTFLWEQMDNEASTQPPVATATGGPSFRSFDPSLDSSRYFPRLSALATNGPFTWESLPSVARVMDFRLTVKDNHGVGSCNDYVDVTVTTNAAAGPFIVNYPSVTGISWVGGSNQTVTWSVANTDVAPINCSDVRILLSVNGGLSYPFVLNSITANDGSEVIVCPNVSTTTARVMVISSAGTFFDISNNNFTITCGSTVTPLFSGLSNACQNDSSFSLPIQSDNGIPGTWSPPLNLTIAGTSTYNFTSTPNNCAVNTSFSLVVEPMASPLFEAFENVCQGTDIQFSNTSTNGIAGTWSPPASSASPGTTSYIFTPDLGQCADEVNQNLTVLSTPSNLISQNDITLTAQQNNVDYQWLDCATNLPVPGAVSQSFTTGAASGTYAVVVTLNGCSDTSQCITVDQSGLSEHDVTVVLSPNPAGDAVHLTWTGHAIQTVYLMDISGKALSSQVVSGSNSCTFDLSQYASGLYLVVANSANGPSLYKFLKY